MVINVPKIAVAAVVSVAKVERTINEPAEYSTTGYVDLNKIVVTLFLYSSVKDCNQQHSNNISPTLFLL